MDNNGVVLMSVTTNNMLSSEHNHGNPLNPTKLSSAHHTPTNQTIENLVQQPISGVQTSSMETPDGNVQAHIDFAYQNTNNNNNVGIPSAINGDLNGGVNEHKQTVVEVPNGGSGLHQMNIIEKYDDDNHNEKTRNQCCSPLNKLCMFLAIFCFALFMVALAFIIANIDKLNGKYENPRQTQLLSHPQFIARADDRGREPNSAFYYNLTRDNLTVVFCRRGASIYDIIIPNRSQPGGYRSIVLHYNSPSFNETTKYENVSFGAVKFDPEYMMNGQQSLPTDYPFLNSNEQNWTMYTNEYTNDHPYRVRFVNFNQQVEIVYELLANHEFVMTYFVYPPKRSQQQPLMVDLTNFVYFNLRSHGDLSTHQIKVNSSRVVDLNRMPTNIYEQQQQQQQNVNVIKQYTYVNDLVNETKYFYLLDHVGIGKNFVALLNDKETNTRVKIFSDNSGMFIDPSMILKEEINGTISTINGIRLSPRQSPIYQYNPVFGENRLYYPSQSIHTTWFVFEI